MTVLVTGGEGQLGREFASLLENQCLLLSAKQLDITDASKVDATLQRLRPTMVINCAAYTNVDLAEQQVKECEQINAVAPGYLAEACNQVGALLVQISTDYVFGAAGSRHQPYLETDDPDPQGVYARSKFQGEQNAANAKRHLIVRSCGLYGDSPRGNNFVKAMLRQAETGNRLRVVDDQICTPTYTKHLAQAILKLVATDSHGIFHIVNSGSTHWFEFAKAIFELNGRNVFVEPISTAEYSAAAPRPAYSLLDTNKFFLATGDRLPEWRDALREFLGSSLQYPLEIVGRGMIAQAARLHFQPVEKVLLFAAGTGNSETGDKQVFLRERSLLSEALQRCKKQQRRLIYCSSAGRIYDATSSEVIDENTPCRPHCPYGQNKLACEDLIRADQGPHLILRLANLVGPNQNPNQLLPALLQQTSSGTVEVHADATRDLLAVEDLFPLISEILDSTDGAETLIVATGISTPVKQILAWIQNRLSHSLDVHTMKKGHPQVFCTDKLRQFAPRHASFPPNYAQNLVEKYLSQAQSEQLQRPR